MHDDVDLVRRLKARDAAAFDASGLRHLRVGQRLTVSLDPAGRRVVALALGTIGALDRADAGEG